MPRGGLRRRRSIDERGFTLIELLVVMIIIGILAAIAIPLFLAQRTKSFESAAKSDVRNVAGAVESDAVGSRGDYLSVFTGPLAAGTTIAAAAPATWARIGGQVSPGVEIYLGDSPTSDDFCLVSVNTSGGGWFTYSKATGGLNGTVSDTQAAAEGLC